MAGLLTHLTISLVGFILIAFIFKTRGWRYAYGGAFFIGHLLPDIIKFGITGIYINDFSYRAILRSSLFYTLDNYFGFHETGFFFWIMLVLFSLIFFSALAFFKFMRKTKAKNFIITTILLSAGALIHLVIDILIIEKNYWI